ncbi:hypothetical protein M3221_17010 [Domibacillus indicus]|uniref:hypothetical protein n=1 Tax=Domibacillus indicus TaxID=1437523 RepID=UPI00204008DF|nr:hypothetical protein [Domibacillus indicus]MCM3790089.1 hypothetical protein [Domibacillus indicus]
MSEANHQTEKQMISYIRAHHKSGICSKRELSKQIGSISEINQAIDTSSQLVEWGKDQVILAEKLIIRISDRKIITKYFHHAFEKGGFSPHQLLQEMKTDRRLAAILREKRINEPAQLASLIKMLLPNVKGDSQFLQLADSPIDSLNKAETFIGQIPKP